MRKYFGTDGIRGVVGPALTPELAYKTAIAHGFILKKDNPTPKVVMGTDTRNSCDMLMHSMVAGYCYIGVDVLIMGVMPTPALAFLIDENNADAGIMISASHNKHQFNGIKILSKGGIKLPDEDEEEIEKYIIDFDIPMEKKLGCVKYNFEEINKYVNHVIKSTESDLSSLNVLLDCSHGASSPTAKGIFDGLNIKNQILFDDPDGFNINENCGSTHLDVLCAKMKGSNFDIGFAFDGDADRCLAADNQGREIDGDKIMAVIALYLKKCGRLNKDCLVATVMSNLGLIEKMNNNGIEVPVTKVGDRYVIEEMLEKNYSLGGENSGHIIFLEKATTGDGQLTAVMLLCAMKELGLSGNDVYNIFNQYPQRQINVTANDLQKRKLMADEEFVEDIKKAEQAFSGKGRILVRPSGTEPYIRILVEGREEKEVEETAKRIKETTDIRLSQIF